MVQISFDSTTVDPSTGGQSVFENGVHSFHITGSELKPTQKGGTMLVLTASCLDAENSGKRFAIRLNVQNANSQAQEIAFRDLSAICHVTGVLQIQDTQQLHGKPFKIQLEKVAYTKNDGSQGESNEVIAYLDTNGNPPSKGSAATGGNAGAPQAPTAPTAPTQPAAPVAPVQEQPAPVAPTAPAPEQQQQAAPPPPPPAQSQPAAPAQPTAPAAPSAPQAPGVAPWQQG